MRLGFFTSIEGWGGSESYLKSLILGVRKRGHGVILFGVEGSRLFGEMRKEGVDCVAWKQASDAIRHEGTGGGSQDINSKRQEESGRGSGSKLKQLILEMLPVWTKLLMGNIREARSLERLFRLHRVDLMHVAVNGYEVAGIASRRAGIPCLAMNMVTPPVEPSWVRRWLKTYTMRRYDHVSSQSQACTSAWVKYAGLPSHNCSYVWNGADVLRFGGVRGRLRKTANEPFRLVSAGRLHPMKGYRFLLEAIRIGEDRRVSLVILGDGEQRRELESIIDQNNLRPRVFLRGHVENVEDYLKDADCFVLPSVSHESCPAVLAQAMASGLPLITSDFGPLPEVNVNGVTGVVVPAGDPASLATAIRKLADEPQLCEKMGAVGRKRACEYFSVEIMIENTLKLYASLRRNMSS